MQIIKRCLDIFFLIRPVILIPVWGFSIFGYRCGFYNNNSFSIKLLWGKEHITAFYQMLIFSLSVGCVYVLNQISDAEVDSRNRGFSVFVKSDITGRNALWYAFILGLVSIVIPIFTSYIPIAIFSLSAIILGVLYSFKPCFLSGRPFTDFLANAVGFGMIAFGVGWYLSHERSIFNIPFFYASMPYFFLMCAGSISSTIPDCPGDKVCQKNTTPVVLGISNAHIIALACIVAGAVVSFATKDLIALFSALTALPIYILYSIIKSQKLMEATYKIGGGIPMLLACVLYPLLIPIAGSVFIGTWLYFRFRYGISYPSLIPFPEFYDDS